MVYPRYCDNWRSQKLTFVHWPHLLAEPPTDIFSLPAKEILQSSGLSPYDSWRWKSSQRCTPIASALLYSINLCKSPLLKKKNVNVTINLKLHNIRYRYYNTCVNIVARHRNFRARQTEYRELRNGIRGKIIVFLQSCR